MAADLHLHTNRSDGTETPQRVLELAKAAGLSTIALTDHDTTEALAVAAPLAAPLGIELIAGIEMSSSIGEVEVHVLGFFMDTAHEGLRRHLEEQQARRVERVKEMVRRLNRQGLLITAEEVFALSGQGTVGRPHVARALLNRGYITTTVEAFDRYIGSAKHPAFVPGSPLPPERIIRLIREADGIPVLAHPIYLKDDTLIPTFVRQGLVGLEVYHSGHSPEHVRRYERMARELSLLMTGGSDYHGESKEGLPVGTVRLADEHVDALKRWKTAHA